MSPIDPAELEKALRKGFGFSEFRTGQLELIGAVLTGRDALGVLPTGGGKSLAYQLPAVMLQGLTVVVSPLIALMKDQVDAFNRRGKGLAVAVHSNLDPAQARQAFTLASSGKASLLYVAPERFEYAGFRERILALKPKLFVVDEAHCVNQWGYDFRPSYLALAQVASVLRPAPILALTATATPSTRNEVVGRLGLQKPLVFVAPFDRPNLRFEVHSCGPKEKTPRLRRILRESAGTGSHLVYVGRRKDAEEIAFDLNSIGLGAVAYHAGMAAQARREAQEAWLAGRKPVAVATVAFGMGIDKADVRTVIHYQHPSSLEAYYQEAGRGGRDGAPARCITLYSKRDVALSHFFIRNRYPLPEQVLQLLALISPEGTTPAGLRVVAGDLSDEQLNMALWVLSEQGRIWRDDEGILRRRDRKNAGPVSMTSLWTRKSADYRRLEEVLAYCEDPVCHRTHLLRYFGEKLSRDFRCGNCSACRGGTAVTAEAAAQDEAERIFQLNRDALEAWGNLSPKSLAQFLGGSKARGLPQAWRKFRGFGALAHVPAGRLQEWSARILDSACGAPSAGGQLRLLRATTGKSQAGETERPNLPAAAADEEKESAPALWQSPKRTYAVDELRAREVPRNTGLSILRLAEEASRPLPASSMANVLLGARKSDCVQSHPELLRLNCFGAERGSGYGELLHHILSMWAKGYLELCAGKSRQLKLTETGRKVLLRSIKPGRRRQ